MHQPTQIPQLGRIPDSLVRCTRENGESLQYPTPSAATASARPEDLGEDRVPLLLVVGREHCWQHLLLVQHLHHAWRIGLDIEPRWQPAELGEELLRLLAQHEVRGEQR